MTKAVIVSAVRTAIGTFNGGLASVKAVDLGAHVINAALARAGIESARVNEVIMGNVLQAGLGQNPARQAALLAGVANQVPAFTVNKVCGSGLKSVALAAQSILAGDADIIVAGGMENMSQAPFVLDSRARWGLKMGNSELTDVLLSDGLMCATNHYHMGITAENIAEQCGISREMQDETALRSQQLAQKAIEQGKFVDEIAPIVIKTRKGETRFAQDEHPKFNSTREGLAKLRPAFKADGTVTAGNASGINDGAAAFVVMSENKASELGLKPLATIRSYASAGVDPKVMGLGPIPASRLALQKANLALSDIDLIEANEAFASQFLAVGQALGFDLAKTNVNGGAIALGHPIGASGARILVSLLYEMIHSNKQFGLATLCIGGGQGIAMIIERN